MIIRKWKGTTRKDEADRYVEYMKKTGLPGYLDTEGNRGAILLRRDHHEDLTDFVFLSRWDSFDSIQSFAGDDHERAVFYPEDDAFLVDRDTHVDHYEVAVDAWDPPDAGGDK